MTTVTSEEANQALLTIEKIREALLFSETPIESNLFALHYVSDLLKLNDIQTWIELESKGFNDENLPKYRMRVFGRYDVSSHHTVPVELLNISEHVIYSPCITLAELLKSDRDSFLLALPDDLIASINTKYKLNLTSTEISIKLRRTTIVKILSSIKLEILQNCEKAEKMARDILRNNPINKVGQLIQNYDSKKVFIVHGRDDVVKNELYNILRDRLKLEPIILMQEPNGGKTLIEKFESHSINVGYAFILLTPDDVGMLKDDFDKYNENYPKISQEIELRPRQNVLLELGYFVGKLGRERVCCLQKGNKNLLPTDLHGLVTIQFTESIKQAYLDIENELSRAGYVKSS